MKTTTNRDWTAMLLRLLLWAMLGAIIAAILAVKAAAAQTPSPAPLIPQRVLVSLPDGTPLADVTMTVLRDGQPVLSAVTGSDGQLVLPLTDGPAVLLVAGTLSDGTVIQWESVYRERGEIVYITPDPAVLHLIVTPDGNASIEVIFVGDPRLGPGSNPTANPPTPSAWLTVTPIPLAATVLRPTAVPPSMLAVPAVPAAVPAVIATPTHEALGGGQQGGFPPAAPRTSAAADAPIPWGWLGLGGGLGLGLAWIGQRVIRRTTGGAGMMRAVSLLLTLLTLTGCAAGVAKPAAVPLVGRPALALTPTVDPAASGWLVSPAAETASAGAVRGIRVALDGHNHPHTVAVSALEWLGSADEAGVLVQGTTPAGDAYAVRLRTTHAGWPNTGIGALDQRVVVTAGGPEGLAAWESPDGGVTWRDLALPSVLASGWQADVGFVPDGRLVLLAGVGADARLQTWSAVEDGAGGWQTTPLGAPNAAATQHTLWSAVVEPQPTTQPALVALVSRSGGMTAYRSMDGVQWESTVVASATAQTPRLIAAGHTLVATHSVYGRTGLWVVGSTDGGATWQAVQLPGLLVSATPLWDAGRATVGILAARAEPTTGWQTIVLQTAPLAQLLDPLAWTPDPGGPDAWLPLALTGGQTEQARPWLVQRGDAAVVAWEGWTRPVVRQATDGDFRPRSVLMQAVVRPAWLAAAVQAQQEVSR